MQEVEQLVCYTANSKEMPYHCHSCQPTLHSPCATRTHRKQGLLEEAVCSLHQDYAGLRGVLAVVCAMLTASPRSPGIHVCASTGLYHLAEDHFILCCCEFSAVAGCIVAALCLGGVLLLPWCPAQQVSQPQVEVTSSASLKSLLNNK